MLIVFTLSMGQLVITSYSIHYTKLYDNLIESGRTRHEVDWLYGINLSRALTFAARNWSGRYSTLSTGRVQGPTLTFLAAKERELIHFVSKSYWKITSYNFV